MAHQLSTDIFYVVEDGVDPTLPNREELTTAPNLVSFGTIGASLEDDITVFKYGSVSLQLENVTLSDFSGDAQGGRPIAVEITDDTLSEVVFYGFIDFDSLSYDYKSQVLTCTAFTWDKLLEKAGEFTPRTAFQSSLAYYYQSGISAEDNPNAPTLKINDVFGLSAIMDIGAVLVVKAETSEQDTSLEYRFVITSTPSLSSGIWTVNIGPGQLEDNEWDGPYTGVDYYHAIFSPTLATFDKNLLWASTAIWPIPYVPGRSEIGLKGAPPGTMMGFDPGGGGNLWERVLWRRIEDMTVAYKDGEGFGWVIKLSTPAPNGLTDTTPIYFASPIVLGGGKEVTILENVIFTSDAGGADVDPIPAEDVLTAIFNTEDTLASLIKNETVAVNGSPGNVDRRINFPTSRTESLSILQKSCEFFLEIVPSATKVNGVRRIIPTITTREYLSDLTPTNVSVPIEFEYQPSVNKTKTIVVKGHSAFNVVNYGESVGWYPEGPQSYYQKPPNGKADVVEIDTSIIPPSGEGDLLGILEDKFKNDERLKGIARRYYENFYEDFWEEGSVQLNGVFTSLLGKKVSETYTSKTGVVLSQEIDFINEVTTLKLRIGTYTPGTNVAPVAKVKGGKNIVSSTGTATCVIDGTGSYDPNGDKLTYSWEEDVGAGYVSIAGATSPILVRSFDSGDKVRLTVSDGSLTGQAETTIEIIPYPNYVDDGYAVLGPIFLDIDIDEGSSTSTNLQLDIEALKEGANIKVEYRIIEDGVQTSSGSWTGFGSISETLAVTRPLSVYGTRDQIKYAQFRGINEDTGEMTVWITVPIDKWPLPQMVNTHAICRVVEKTGNCTIFIEWDADGDTGAVDIEIFKVNVSDEAETSIYSVADQAVSGTHTTSTLSLPAEDQYFIIRFNPKSAPAGSQDGEEYNHFLDNPQRTEIIAPKFYHEAFQITDAGVEKIQVRTYIVKDLLGVIDNALAGARQVGSMIYAQLGAIFEQSADAAHPGGAPFNTWTYFEIVTTLHEKHQVETQIIIRDGSNRTLDTFTHTADRNAIPNILGEITLALGAYSEANETWEVIATWRFDEDADGQRWVTEEKDYGEAPTSEGSLVFGSLDTTTVNGSFIGQKNYIVGTVSKSKTLHVFVRGENSNLATPEGPIYHAEIHGLAIDKFIGGYSPLTCLDKTGRWAFFPNIESISGSTIVRNENRDLVSDPDAVISPDNTSLDYDLIEGLVKTDTGTTYKIVYKADTLGSSSLINFFVVGQSRRTTSSETSLLKIEAGANCVYELKYLSTGVLRLAVTDDGAVSTVNLDADDVVNVGEVSQWAFAVDVFNKLFYLDQRTVSLIWKRKLGWQTVALSGDFHTITGQASQQSNVRATYWGGDKGIPSKAQTLTWANCIGGFAQEKGVEDFNLDQDAILELGATNILVKDFQGNTLYSWAHGLTIDADASRIIWDPTISKVVFGNGTKVYAGALGVAPSEVYDFTGTKKAQGLCYRPSDQTVYVGTSDAAGTGDGDLGTLTDRTSATWTFTSLGYTTYQIKDLRYGKVDGTNENDRFLILEGDGKMYEIKYDGTSVASVSAVSGSIIAVEWSRKHESVYWKESDGYVYRAEPTILGGDGIDSTYWTLVDGTSITSGGAKDLSVHTSNFWMWANLSISAADHIARFDADENDQTTYADLGSQGEEISSASLLKLGLTAPATPTNFTATAVSSTQINCSWTDVSGETGYRLRYRKTSESTWTTLSDLSADDVAEAVTSLVASTAYTIQIAAFNSKGFSDWAETTEATEYASSELLLLRVKAGSEEQLRIIDPADGSVLSTLVNLSTSATNQCRAAYLPSEDCYVYADGETVRRIDPDDTGDAEVHDFGTNYTVRALYYDAATGRIYYSTWLSGSTGRSFGYFSDTDQATWTANEISTSFVAADMAISTDDDWNLLDQATTHHLVSRTMGGTNRDSLGPLTTDISVAMDDSVPRGFAVEKYYGNNDIMRYNDPDDLTDATSMVTLNGTDVVAYKTLVFASGYLYYVHYQDATIYKVAASGGLDHDTDAVEINDPGQSIFNIRGLSLAIAA